MASHLTAKAAKPLTWLSAPDQRTAGPWQIYGVLPGQAREEQGHVGSEDEVRLAVPAKPEFLGLARVTAAGLASRLGFSYDQVEDVRLAIDEICFGMTGSKGREGILELRFLLGPDILTVRGEGHFSVPAPVHLSELSEVILDALVDEHSMSDGAGGPRFHLVKKRLPAEVVPGAGSLGAGSLGEGS